jgi:hypothetical protein
MLVVAGVIEAFISPTNLPIGAKFALAAALLTLLIAYLWMPERTRKSAVPDSQAAGS